MNRITADLADMNRTRVNSVGTMLKKIQNWGRYKICIQPEDMQTYAVSLRHLVTQFLAGLSNYVFIFHFYFSILISPAGNT